ncbi:uncharacterized protein LOC105280614 isoform X2 [Ooceraea biroi]|uniref:uncharacterized protein LOC105280614 isoform X2 n=1 Tax=Ooceraea biroi TaxID=2015173 RepID=UPI0009716A7F|nr:uncharacterized protein LOC105280614 isoform X2 [Ooceraea biroi]
MDSRALSSDIFSKMQDFPPLEATVKNIGRNWWMWKKNFLSFLQKEDPKELYKDQWVTFFLMLIGPLGKQAYKDLSSRNAQRTKELKILLSDLDLYFIFGVKNKPTDENIDRYIDSLMLLAIASNHSDPVSIVKEKIIQDIRNCNFTGKTMLFLQSRGENLVSYLQLLDLHKITLFWKHCEELTAQTNAPKEVTINAQLGDARCIRCGTCHDRNNCPAHGMQCTNCKGYNHFTRNCKVKYVRNCTKCGLDHVQSRCLAFGERCTKCGKTNHFSWLCQVPVVKDCSRCGGDHAVSACPAQGRMCSRCNKPNHLKEKCVSKLNVKE